MEKSVYTGLKRTTKEINREFNIKAFGHNYDGEKIDHSVGVSGLINLIGIDLTNKLIERAFKSMDDAIYCKLRRGILITFYRH